MGSPTRAYMPVPSRPRAVQGALEKPVKAGNIWIQTGMAAVGAQATVCSCNSTETAQQPRTFGHLHRGSREETEPTQGVDEEEE